VVTASSPSLIDGDFNDDGLYDCVDVNLLVDAVAHGGSVALYDLSGDGALSLADVDAWRMEAGEVNLGVGRVYKVGDANLDSVVDGADFNLWNSNKFTALAAWCGGDFNADGFVDGGDFNLWNANKFTSADGGRSVEQPAIQIAAFEQPGDEFSPVPQDLSKSQRGLSVETQDTSTGQGVTHLQNMPTMGQSRPMTIRRLRAPESQWGAQGRRVDAIEYLFAHEELT
jgi:hypothetical protein